MSRVLTFSFISISVLSVVFGFVINEDLSTGGAEKDFILTMNAVKELSTGSFESYYRFTKHFPLHYLSLSLILPEQKLTILL